jgi:hypothetical protein
MNPEVIPPFPTPDSGRSGRHWPLWGGLVAYLVAAYLLAAWWGLGILVVTSAAFVAWRRRDSFGHHSALDPWHPSRLVEMIMRKVVVEEDGLRRVLLWGLVGTVAAGIVAAVALVVVLVAGRGLPLLAGIVIGGLLAYGRHIMLRRNSLPDRT